MARLYWRVKVDGKWTWRPAVYDLHKDRYEEIGGCEVTLWWPTDEELSISLQEEEE